MKDRFVPQSPNVVKCCFLYVPTLTELSRASFSMSAFILNFPQRLTGVAPSRIYVPVCTQCAVVAPRSSYCKPLFRFVDNCASTVLHMSALYWFSNSGVHQCQTPEEKVHLFKSKRSSRTDTIARKVVY